MKLNKIYIREWLILKPYENHSITDNYYLKLCNDIKKVLFDNIDIFVVNLDEDDINLFSCFIVSYFEDIISETHIFTSFVNRHEELYDKKLPFFDTSTYYENEINTQDIQFLIWYFLNTIQGKSFLSPHKDEFFKLAEALMHVLEQEYEYAPENNVLKEFYSLPENETDFYKCREMIDAVLFRSYLFHTDTHNILEEKVIEIIENSKSDENLISYLRDNRDAELFSAHTKLLSLKGNEWVAEILGKEHPLYQAFYNIPQKITGYFFYKGQDEKSIFLEHIASSKKFELTKKSFDSTHVLTDIDTIIFMGMVSWLDEWWFSGIFFLQDFNADLILDEKNSIESRRMVSFLDHTDEAIKTNLERQNHAFLDFNNQKQIAFLPADKVEDFTKEYFEFFNTSLDLSEKELEKVSERSKKDGFFGGLEDNDLNYYSDSETALVFFNPKSGLEIGFEVASAFPYKENKYYNAEKSTEHTMRLIMSESISTELMLHCVANFEKEAPFFKTNEGKFFMKDLDFLLRFFKTSQYYSKPQITLTGKEA